MLQIATLRITDADAGFAASDIVLLFIFPLERAIIEQSIDVAGSWVGICGLH